MFISCKSQSLQWFKLSEYTRCRWQLSGRWRWEGSAPMSSAYSARSSTASGWKLPLSTCQLTSPGLTPALTLVLTPAPALTPVPARQNSSPRGSTAAIGVRRFQSRSARRSARRLARRSAWRGTAGGRWPVDSGGGWWASFAACLTAPLRRWWWMRACTRTTSGRV